MKRTLKRISPLPLAKIFAALHGLGSLIFVPFFLLITLISFMAPKFSGSQGAPAALGIIELLIPLVLMILLPVFYALMGFVVGLIGALIYNLVAKWLGGIEVEVE